MMEVSNFIWLGDRPALASDFSSAKVLQRTMPAISGQYAFAIQAPEGDHLLVRDPLGVNKLFFAVRDDNAVDSSNFLIALIRRGYRLEDVFSVPSGHILTVNPTRRCLTLTKYSELTFGDGNTGSLSLDDHATKIRRRLAEVFSRLRPVLAGRPLFVTLSGGLDSTTIAVMAREYLGDFTAVTFSMKHGDAGSETSEDLHFARLVAGRLAVPMETVFATPDDIVSLLDVALVYGQDWRDFNVHCALVNAKIAAHLAEKYTSSGGARPVVLTGDTMNELMADYSPVVYGDTEFYALPRLPAGRLRRFLISGLDAGDREIGIFSHYGLDVIQPYAMLASDYAALPDTYVQSPDAKQRLVQKIMGDKIPAEIYRRPKVRAQVGGSKQVGGTLGALIDAGLTRDRLLHRFADLFDCSAGGASGLIRAGFYRFTNTYPGKGDKE